MLSFSPLSTTPLSSLGGISLLYVSAIFNAEGNLDLLPNIKLYESATFDCFADLSAGLYVVKEINVYYTVYVTTDKNYIMTLNTTDIETLYRASDFYSNFYVNTDLNYQLTVTRSLDLLLNAVKETPDGF
jgi:hypothetical protein